MRNYITYKSDEYFLLGHYDGLNETKKQTDIILNSLSGIMNYKFIKRCLVNYLHGYKIGVLEYYLKKLEPNAYFDLTTKSFKKGNIEIKRTEASLKKDAKKEAIKTLKNDKHSLI